MRVSFSVKLLVSFFLLIYSSIVFSAEENKNGVEKTVSIKVVDDESLNNKSVSNEVTTNTSGSRSNVQLRTSNETRSLLDQFEVDANDKRYLFKTNSLNNLTTGPHYMPPPLQSSMPSSLSPPKPPLKPLSKPLPKPPSNDDNNDIEPPPTYRLKSNHDSYKMSPKSYSPLSRGGALLSYKTLYQGNLVYVKYLSNFPIPEYSKCARTYHTLPKFRASDLIAAFADAERGLKEYLRMEKEQFKRGIYLNFSVVSTASRHLVHDVARRNLGEHLKERDARRMEYAAKYLAENYCLSALEINLILPNVVIPPQVKLSPSCQPSYYDYHKCKDSKYRTLNGRCNNLKKPDWGMSYSCQQRLLPPAYKDGISAPRSSSVTGSPLPPPRYLSTYSHPDVVDYGFYTIFKVLWGQFVNHDLISTPASQPEQDGSIKCCPEPKHPQCYPIKLMKDDYQSVNFKRTCMNVVRSAPCPLCTLGPRQQANSVTSFLDASTIYGSAYETLHRLRLYNRGMMKLKKSEDHLITLLTTEHPEFDQCDSKKKNWLCFDSGDTRVNQHPGLMIAHLIMTKRHNNHAHYLHVVNPHWDDEKLFQEARRILIAEIQHITYNEYLPIIFGPTLTEYYKFVDRSYNGFSLYEPDTDPSIFNEYSAAAGRFGHSSIPSFHPFDLIHQKGKKYKNNTGYFLRDMYFNPNLIYEGYMDYMIKGYLSGSGLEVDPYHTQDIKNYLYKVTERKFGNDLPALNIQRGREHGIPPYYIFLEFCYGYEVISWEDLKYFIPNNKLQMLQSLYAHWKDIDLFTGGVYERKSPDADFGPTFACIIGIQFYHLKHGDRYFYTHGNQSGSFTKEQLDNIVFSTSLSKILCKTNEQLDAVQPYAFFPPSNTNVPKQCNEYNDLNYELWKED